MKNLTVKQAESYICENYGQPRHNVSAIVKACKHVGKLCKQRPIDLFFLLIENRPMEGTHSYGFHTGYGRELINTIQSYYYSYDRGLELEQIAILLEQNYNQR